MNEMEKLQYVLFERLHRRAPGIDKLDRLWDAAVLLPLVRTPEGISVLFEERAHTLRSQPGEVCFPGGKYECEDNSFRNTAVRASRAQLEEKPEDITMCGVLVWLVAHTGQNNHPSVGRIDDISKITYSKSEVERIFTVPLKMLLEQKPRRGSVQLADHPGDDFPFDLVPQRKRGWRMNKSYYVYFYLYEDKVIWGLTARMLYAFLYRSRKELTEYLAEEID